MKTPFLGRVLLFEHWAERCLSCLALACIFLEKNMDWYTFPKELFRNKYSLTNPTDHVLLPDHLLKCWKGWTGFLRNVTVSQSVALPKEVAVVLHHHADHKKYSLEGNRNSMSSVKHYESYCKCKWLKILQMVIIRPKSRLFCLESSFLCRFAGNRQHWQTSAALWWEWRCSTALPVVWQSTLLTAVQILVLVPLSFLPGIITQKKHSSQGSTAKCVTSFMVSPLCPF